MSSIFNISNNKINICIKDKNFQPTCGKITIFNNIKEIEECKNEISFSLSLSSIRDILENFKKHNYNNIVEKVIKENFNNFNNFIIPYVQYEVNIEFEIGDTIYWKNASNIIFLNDSKEKLVVSLLNKSYYELVFRSKEINTYLAMFIKRMHVELETCKFYQGIYKYHCCEIIKYIKRVLFDMKFKGKFIKFYDLSEKQQNEITAYLLISDHSKQYSYCLYKSQRKFKSVVEWIHKTNEKLQIPIHYMNVENELVVMIPTIE